MHFGSECLQGTRLGRIEIDISSPMPLILSVLFIIVHHYASFRNHVRLRVAPCNLRALCVSKAKFCNDCVPFIAFIFVTMRVEAPSLSLAELPNVVVNVRRVIATDRFDVELADGTVIRASPL